MTTKKQALVESTAEMVAMGLPARAVAVIQRQARRIHRWNEADCNWGLRASQEEARERAEEAVVELARCHGLHAYVQHDPRGWPVLLSTDTITPDDTLRSGIVRVCPY